MDFELILLRGASVLFLAIGLPAPIGLIAHALTALRLNFAPRDRSASAVSILPRFAIEQEVIHE